MGGFLRDSRVLVKLGRLAMRLWAFSGAMLFACFVLYYLYGGLLAFFLLVFAGTGILYHAEDQLLFHPELPSHSRVFVPVPSMYGLPYENLHVRSRDGTLLHVFFVRQPEDRASRCPTVVFLHGNGGNMGHRLQNTLGLYHNLHCNVLMLEYRGYGLSEGVPSEEGLCMDACACLDYLASRTDVNHSEIVVFGRSLGGAVAIDLASRPEYAAKIWCLVLENTFTSIPDMAKVLLTWRLLHYLPLFFYKNKFLSLYKVASVSTATLFISGLSDTLVPPRMMSQLHAQCGSARKQLLQLSSGTHNETWTLQGYYHSIAVFLQNCRLQPLRQENEPPPPPPSPQQYHHHHHHHHQHQQKQHQKFSKVHNV